MQCKQGVLLQIPPMNLLGDGGVGGELLLFDLDFVQPWFLTLCAITVHRICLLVTIVLICYDVWEQSECARISLFQREHDRGAGLARDP